MASTVDTVKVGGSCSGVDQDSEGWKFSGKVGAAGKWSITSKGRELFPGVWLSVNPGREIQTAWVEGSAAGYVQEGANFPALPVEHVPEIGHEWIEAASEFVTWEEGPRINRLDVVKDLDVGVDRVDEVLQAVGGFVSGGRATRATYRDPTANRAMTVWTRTKRSGGGRLYDKRAESDLETAAGIVRFEGQERVNTLKREGVRKLEAVTSGNVDRLLRDRWLWCGYGDVVVPRETLIRDVLSWEGWRWDTKLKVAGWIAAGFPTLPDRTTEWRYRNRLRAVGQAGDVPGSWRLDLNDGLVEIAAA